MSILSRFTNRLWPRRLARDLEDEVEFHINMRASEFCKAGMSVDEATKEAHQQFGDVDSVMAEMRKERLTSTAMVLALTALLAVVMLWVALQRLASTELRMPAVAAAPIFRDPNRLMTGSPPPPRPGPGPTWTQFVKQTKAFEALQKGPGTYSPGRLLDDEGRLIDDAAKTR